jgi:IclR family transcriptional regulator, acetate operon repressor
MTSIVSENLVNFVYRMKPLSALIGHCLAVLELLATEGRDVRFAEIVEQTAMPKGSAHLLLSTLCVHGWVEQDPSTGTYRLGMRLPVLGQRFLIGTGIPDICQPVLDRLARESGELVRLAIVSGDGLTWVSQAQGARTGLIYQPQMTGRVNLPVTATGKAWLATLPRGEAVKIILKAGFGNPEHLGPNAVRSVDAMIGQIALSQERGYGLVIEEAEVGIVGVAAAIRPGGGDAVGTISIAGPVFRINDNRIPELARLVQAAATDLATVWPLRPLHEPTIMREVEPVRS